MLGPILGRVLLSAIGLCLIDTVLIVYEENEPCVPHRMINECPWFDLISSLSASLSAAGCLMQWVKEEQALTTPLQSPCQLSGASPACCTIFPACHAAHPYGQHLPLQESSSRHLWLDFYLQFSLLYLPFTFQHPLFLIISDNEDFPL